MFHFLNVGTDTLSNVKQPPSTHDKSSRTTNGSSITSSPKVFLQENIYKKTDLKGRSPFVGRSVKFEGRKRQLYNIISLNTVTFLFLLINIYICILLIFALFLFY